MAQSRRAAMDLTSRAVNASDPAAFFEQFLGLTKDATEAGAAGAIYDYEKNVGRMLGGLNQIGALRSGAAISGTRDLTMGLGREIGRIASANATTGLNLGANVANFLLDRDKYEFERKFKLDEASRARKGGLLGTIGGLAGSLIGGGFNPLSLFSSLANRPASTGTTGRRSFWGGI